MSEKVLKALMQLFAIVARPQSNAADRRKVVEAFLLQLLNREQIDSYLKVFDKYYQTYQQKQSGKKRKKAISLSSVKVLKICTEMNEELTHQQKVVVLIRLLEFIKSDPYHPEITEEGDDSGLMEIVEEQENEFVVTVAEVFNIATPEDDTEFVRLKAFVSYDFDKIPNSGKILVVNNDERYDHPKTKHIYRHNLNGQLRIFNMTSSKMYLLRYLGDSELSLNGQLIKKDKVYVLPTGSTIRKQKMESLYYSDIERIFAQDADATRCVFEVKDIVYKFKGGKVGLHPMRFSEESGTLVGIMGASGAGKSTLLNVLNGANPPTEGEICINGYNIHVEKESVDGLIGHVSQDDLLIEELTVFQNLYYNAKLCFDNYNEEQLVETVDSLLMSLGLFEIKNMVVGNPLNKKISGGQRKRLNISLELIREPAVLFLDEPTSGLSSRDSENIMDLLKELAKKGKLIFVVIHQPSSDIFKMFDKLYILDTGGYLIYSGNPVSAIGYFKDAIEQANQESECPHCGNVNPEQIFNIIETNVLDEYGKFTRTRKVPPHEWYGIYNERENDKNKPPADIPKKVPEISFKIPNRFKQFKVFTIRDVLSKLTNSQYVAINMIEAPLLAFFLAFIIRYFNVDVANEFGYTLSDNNNLPVYIFMSVIVAIFVGLTVSAEEIIKDRLILKRESFLNLSRSSYLMSKVVILFTLSAIQALMFVLIGNSIMGISGMYFHYWLVLFSSFCFANMLGLNVSDSFETPVTIYILIPFLVIPQMILSGIIVKFDELNPVVSSPTEIPVYGEAMTARWAYEALAVHQFKENEFEKNFFEFDKRMNTANYKKDYWLNNLQNKVNRCKRNIRNLTLIADEKKAFPIDSVKALDRLDKDSVEVMKQFEKDLLLLRNELNDEVELHPKFAKLFPQELRDKLFVEKFTNEVVDEYKNAFKRVKKYYIDIYNKYNAKKQQYIAKQTNTPEKNDEFILLRKEYENESLMDLVRNSNSTIKILEYEDRLYRKVDPIFQDPESKFIKAHFYAPRKQVFGVWMETFWVNLIVIWFSVISLYITLYYRLLRKALDFFGRMTEKFKKAKD